MVHRPAACIFVFDLHWSRWPRGHSELGDRQGRRLHERTSCSLLQPVAVVAISMTVCGRPQREEVVDMYARADITQLAKANSYARLQWEDLTVEHALSLASPTQSPWAHGPANHIMVSLSLAPSGDDGQHAPAPGTSVRGEGTWC